ncbi:MAG: redoxin domain-containing protein [Ignavibacteriaceae bacterium]
MARVSFFLSFLFFFSSLVLSKTIVYGKVTGVDGKPIPVVHIFLTYPSDDIPVRSVIAQKNGNYRIEIDSDSLWVLHFTGIFHHEYPIAIYNIQSRKIKLDVKLRTYDYKNNFSTAKIIGKFNGWSEVRGVSLKKEKNGTYSAIVESKSDSVIYRLINVRTGGKVEGTDADGYIPNGVDPKGTEGYNSFLIKKKGKVKIVFDPEKLVHSNQPTQFTLTPAGSFEAKFAHAYATLEDTRQEYESSLYAHLAEFRFNFKFDFVSYIDSVKNLLENETNPLIKQVLHLSLYGLKYMATFDHNIDAKTSYKLLDNLPPGSVIWSLDPSLMVKALNLAAYSEPEKDKYVHKVLDLNPMNRTKEILLHFEIDRKFHSLQYAGILPYLSILLDQYGDSPEALEDGKIYERYIKLKSGMKAPEFSVRSLSDSSRNFTNKSFASKYYLLNFWSSTNPASVDEIQNLKKEYKKYGRKKLDILSISVDSVSDNAMKFVKTKTNIPWDIAFVENQLDNQFCKNYEVYSVPKSILINPEGEVVATGWKLRGRNLKETLKKILE